MGNNNRPGSVITGETPHEPFEVDGVFYTVVELTWNGIHGRSYEVVRVADHLTLTEHESFDHYPTTAEVRALVSAAQEPGDSVPGLIEVHARTRSLRWRTGGRMVVLKYFPDSGIVDYADVRDEARTHATGPSVHLLGNSEAASGRAATLPTYGQPLTVSTELGALFWRHGNLLHQAPVEHGAVDWTATAPVQWTDHPAEYADIEHNLCQMTPGLGPSPELGVLRIDRATSHLSIARLLAGPSGEPVIGEESDQPLPWLRPREVDRALTRGFDAVVEMWERELRDQGLWTLLTGEQADTVLRAAGYALPATEPGSSRTAALTTADLDRTWGPGWYDGTRIIALAAFTRRHGYRGYSCRSSAGPTARPAIIRPTDPERWTFAYARGDVARLPADEMTYVGADWSHGGRSEPVPARDIVLEEPILRAAPGPRLHPDTSDTWWVGFCRRCGVPMSNGEWIQWVPPGDRIYAQDAHGRTALWCSAHPDRAGRHPHAPTCGIDAERALRGDDGAQTPQDD